MFPPRPNPTMVLRRPARLLAAGEVFGPPPGPANAIGSSGGGSVFGSTAGEIGYGDMPYGDASAGVNDGVNGEDPRIVGYVTRLSEFNFTAQRTQTWGGTTIVSATFNECRMFLEGACGQTLRQEQMNMDSGQLMFKFTNPAYEVAQAADPESGYGD